MDDFPGLGRLLIRGIPGLFLEGPGEDFKESLERSEVLLFRSRDGFLETVVAGDEDRIGSAHRLRLLD